MFIRIKETRLRVDQIVTYNTDKEQLKIVVEIMKSSDHQGEKSLFHFDFNLESDYLYYQNKLDKELDAV